jgi:hypothetical protein
MSTENATPASGNEEQPAHKEHHSWLSETLGKINTEFPLSGGETNEDLEKVIEPESHPDHPDHESWLKRTLHKIEHTLDNINTDFPLSGGETDEDLERVEHSK